MVSEERFFVLIENEVLNVRVVEEQKSSELPKKLGDFCFGVAAAMGVALFMEVVLKKETSVSGIEIVLCVGFFLVLFISGILMYRKGDL